MAWLETGASTDPHLDCPAEVAALLDDAEEAMCSPSGSTLTRARIPPRVLDGSESVIDELRLVADRHQRDRLLSFATRYDPRTWAIEGAGGLGALLAQQLVTAGESVLDGPLNSGRGSWLSARRCTASSTSTGTGGKWRNEHAVQHAPEWNVVATMRDLLDMMLGTALAAVLGEQVEAHARSSGDVDAEPPLARRPTAPCGRRSAR